MKPFKLISACLFAVLAFSANAALAEDCSWGTYQIQTVSNGLKISFLCQDGSSTKATKTVVSPVKGSPTCSMSLASGYRNSGTCASPDIEEVPRTCPKIDIGMSCKGENWCAEAFGRTCYNRGGKTEYEYNNMVCREDCN